LRWLLEKLSLTSVFDYGNRNDYPAG